MKFKSILLAGAVAALPLVAIAQQPPPRQQPPGNDSGEMKLVTATGTVQSFDAGRSITITTASGDQVTYTLNESSVIPKTVEIGKTVTITATSNASGSVVKTIAVMPTRDSKKKSY